MDEKTVPTPEHGQIWKLNNKTYRHTDLVRVEQQLDLVSGGTYVLYWYVGVLNQRAPIIQHIESFLYEKEYVRGS